MNTINAAKKILQKLIVSGDVLLNENERHGIVAAYMFGSFAKGAEREKSDIDIAFAFYESFYKEDPFKALQTAQILGARLGRKVTRTVDVAILNGSSLNFAYHVVREGMCIYESNTTDRILYEVTLDNKYQDFAPFIRELRKTKRKALFGRD